MTTYRHNLLVCRCLQQKKEIEDLNRKLRLYSNVSQVTQDGKLRKANSLALFNADDSGIESPSIKPKRKRPRIKELNSIQLLPEIRSKLIEVRHYDLDKFKPVNTEEIYLRLYFIEKEIKRHESDMYFRLKEFTLQESIDLSYYDITRFAEEQAHQIFKKKKVDPSLLSKGEMELQREIEEFCFEVMYHKLFKDCTADEENRNARTQERLFILQNLVSPSMAGIREEHYAYNVYQLAFAGSLM